MSDTENLFLAGKILSPHGIKGMVKIRSFCESADSFIDLNPFYICHQSGSTGHWLNLKLVSEKQNILTCGVEGVQDRTSAELLAGSNIYADKSKLPASTENEFYTHDLINLACYLEDNQLFGVITGLYNFGASDIVELRLESTGELKMYALTEDTFPVIQKNRLTIRPPEEV